MERRRERMEEGEADKKVIREGERCEGREKVNKVEKKKKT